MRDWADRLAASLIAGFMDGTTTQQSLAMELRMVAQRHHLKGVNETAKFVDEAFAKHSMGGGNK